MTPRPVRKKVKRLDGQLNVGVNAKGNLVKMRPVGKKKVHRHRYSEKGYLGFAITGNYQGKFKYCRCGERKP